MRARGVLMLLLGCTAPLDAQQIGFAPRVQHEVRAEAAMARYGSAAVLVGANVPMGYYVRTGLAAGGGVADGPDGMMRSLRLDGTVRFLLDPFAEHKWGPYAGGGLSVRQNGDARPDVGLLLVLGFEGARRGRWTPAVECSLGEGVRVALAWRRTRSNGR